MDNIIFSCYYCCEFESSKERKREEKIEEAAEEEDEEGTKSISYQDYYQAGLWLLKFSGYEK